MNSVRRQIVITADGSATIHLPDLDESYHSKHGALQEADHVFISNGLNLVAREPVSILEMGFGTGLNALLTLLRAKSRTVDYVGVEAFPVSFDEAKQMAYASSMNAPELEDVFLQIHQMPWNDPVQLTDHFTLEKKDIRFDEIDFVNRFDLVYFDAFGFRVQPELWSTEIFQLLYDALKPGGLLVTYAARTVIKRNMEQAGFTVTKCPGPPGKREMMRASKAV